MDPLQILVGAGNLYIAPKGETFPAIDADPAGNWEFLGETDGGVTVTLSQVVDLHRVDQFTGPVKATRSEETLKIETNVAVTTAELLAFMNGNSVTDTAAGAGTAGTRKLGLTSGFDVTEYAFLFRGNSPYQAGANAQFEVVVGVFNQDDIGLEFKKDDKTLVPIMVTALVDPDAASEDEQFGRFIAQDASPTS